MPKLRAYLAGPDVFLPNAVEIGARKKDICAAHGIEGRFPLDNEIDGRWLRPQKLGYCISSANEAMMSGCDLIIANMTPFRGPSCDVGTAFEMGFARARGIPVFAYTNAAESFFDRTKKSLGATIYMGPDGLLRDVDGMSLENFQLQDNLMLDGAVVASGAGPIIARADVDATDRYSALTAFEACVRHAARVMAKLEPVESRL